MRIVFLRHPRNMHTPHTFCCLFVRVCVCVCEMFLRAVVISLISYVVCSVLTVFNAIQFPIGRTSLFLNNYIFEVFITLLLSLNRSIALADDGSNRFRTMKEQMLFNRKSKPIRYTQQCILRNCRIIIIYYCAYCVKSQTLFVIVLHFMGYINIFMRHV